MSRVSVEIEYGRVMGDIFGPASDEGLFNIMKITHPETNEGK